MPRGFHTFDNNHESNSPDTTSLPRVKERVSPQPRSSPLSPSINAFPPVLVSSRAKFSPQYIDEHQSSGITMEGKSCSFPGRIKSDRGKRVAVQNNAHIWPTNQNVRTIDETKGVVVNIVSCDPPHRSSSRSYGSSTRCRSSSHCDTTGLDDDSLINPPPPIPPRIHRFCCTRSPSDSQLNYLLHTNSYEPVPTDKKPNNDQRKQACLGGKTEVPSKPVPIHTTQPSAPITSSSQFPKAGNPAILSRQDTLDGIDDSVSFGPPNPTTSVTQQPVIQQTEKRTFHAMARQPDSKNDYSRLDSLTEPNPKSAGRSMQVSTNRFNFTDSISSQSSCPTGSVVSFHHISYNVKLRKTPFTRSVIKNVLDDVSGILRPGLNAIMGGTGSGKSSLLDVLAGRKDPKYLEGQVLVDGFPQPKNFKCISGYVVQDDIVMGTLTVKENMYFSAALRMTGDCTKEERRRKVHDIMEELGLTHVANSKVGTELFRGVSGGERKRTNIGMELVSDPPVLFLDEPTTGLDAFMAGQVIKTLKTLSRRGRTIIFSIHQPKYSIYKLFDTVTLVSRGKLVYHGPAKHEPIRYFLRLGYMCEDHNNPPDFFMDILHGEAVQDQENGVDNAESVNEAGQIQVVSEKLAAHWKSSMEYNSIMSQLDGIARQAEINRQGDEDKKKVSDVSFASSFCRQLNQVCWRTFINLMRDPLASIVQMVVYLFFALSMGTVYFQLDTSLESGIQNRAGLFFFSTLQVVFVNLGSIELFIKERVLFIHENSSGYYRVSAYFLAKVLCDILPTKVLPVLLFMPICYWMAGLVPQADAFFFFILMLSLTTLAAAAIALFISATFQLFGIANVVVSIIFVFMMVFGGYLINLKSMSVWLNWLRYLSIFRYNMGSLSIMEMKTLEFCPTTNTSVPGHIDTRVCQPGTQYLQEQDIAYETAWDLWSNVLGQSLITIFFYLLCYVQLRRIKKYK